MLTDDNKKSTCWTIFLLSSLWLLVAVAEGKNVITYYTFEQFKTDYAKEYVDKDEMNHRKGIFEENLNKIVQHNTNRKYSGGGYVLAANAFMDLLPNEYPMGLDKFLHPAYQAGADGDLSEEDKKQHSVPDPMWKELQEDPSLLPSQVDWRTQGVVTPVKDQAYCGSCWAFAATAALESHLAIETGHLFTLSPQEMVSCVPNPMRCGGSGGCAGATAELAYDFIIEHGAVTENYMPYESGTGARIDCSLVDNTHDAKSLPLQTERRLGTTTTTITEGAPTYAEGTVATIDGYVVLPSNDYTFLMNAVAKLGPIVVSVAASSWGFYHKGVFTPPKNFALDIDHAVVLDGYGTDEETGEDYWLIRNSWGPFWGEGGYIRLKRTDPRTLVDPEEDCDMDTTPADGDACTVDGNGNPIVPPPVKVCGNSGVLFDSVVPLGGHLLSRTGSFVHVNHYDEE